MCQYQQFLIIQNTSRQENQMARESRLISIHTISSRILCSCFLSSMISDFNNNNQSKNQKKKNHFSKKIGKKKNIKKILHFSYRNLYTASKYPNHPEINQKQYGIIIFCDYYTK